MVAHPWFFEVFRIAQYEYEVICEIYLIQDSGFKT